jgi:hypothetical protein
MFEFGRPSITGMCDEQQEYFVLELQLKSEPFLHSHPVMSD